MDTRCIEENDLIVFFCQNADDAVSRRLCLIGNDGDLFADDRI